MYSMDLKFQRAVWATLFKSDMDGKRLDEIIDIFWQHYKKIARNAAIFFMKSDLKEELELSKKIFVEKLTAAAEEYFKKEDWSNAFKCCHNIYKIDPDNKDNLKKCLECAKTTKLGDLKEAVAYKLATEDEPETLKNLSDIYAENKKFDLAIETYKKYMEVNSKKPAGAEYTNLACIYWEKFHEPGLTRHHEDAEKSYEYFKKALSFDEDSSLYIKNAISACYVTNRAKEEVELWKRFLKVGKLSEEDKFSCGAAFFKVGDFKEYAKYHKSRFTKPKKPSRYPEFVIPEWTGKENLSNKTLLVHYEQGYGDTILYWGYAPRLKKYAKRVVFIVQEEICDLLKNNEYGVEVYPRGTDLNKINCDYHVPSMSLPVVLGLNRENISPEGNYIKVNPKDVETFKKEHFKNNKLKIGFAYKGNSAGNQTRNLPASDLALLDKMNNVEFYCLTMGAPKDELKVFKRNKVYNIAADFKSFKDTAIAIEAMDIVISTDNCVLNLAGAMSKKTLGLYNFQTEFRWYDLNENDCGWYKSVKPIVNERFDEWSVSVKKAISETEKIRKTMKK